MFRTSIFMIIYCVPTLLRFKIWKDNFLMLDALLSSYRILHECVRVKEILNSFALICRQYLTTLYTDV